METKSINNLLKPLQLFNCVKDNDYATLLESLEGPQYKARFTLVAWGSKGAVEIKEGKIKGEEGFSEGTDPLLAVKRLLQRAVQVNFPSRFKGGAIGYLSYDLIRYYEKIPSLVSNVENWPDAEFFIPSNVVLYDNLNSVAYVEGSLPECRGEIWERTNFSEGKPVISSYEFKKNVNEVLNYIKEGYTFQTVISKILTYKYSGDLIDFYIRLRKINPSPYMYFLKFNERVIIGSSPETLFRVDEGVIETFPIAGTIRRGIDPEEDLKLEQTLMRSEKDRAEHLMLVDLARNDIGKVSIPGTVRVPELMYIEKYSHVQHIVSRVIGNLDTRRYDSFDVLKAVFPAGTVSGAPKPMSMRIIERLERYRRGPYAGAVGYFSVDGNAEFAITIRSGFAINGNFRLQAGAGIVADSIPEAEDKEVENKLAALKLAIEERSGGHNTNY
ncbi:anthranilate synthase component I [Sulfolobales archaeon HS-7]|nr:anthranilate synthase component I [Sulfolobales archaeon HS-7]